MEGVLHRNLITNKNSIIREAIFPNLAGSTYSLTFNNTTIDSSYFDGYTTNGSIFSRGYWIDGILDDGVFINSKSSGESINDNIVSPFNNGYFSMFNKRWVSGTFVDGEFINSTWSF